MGLVKLIGKDALGPSYLVLGLQKMYEDGYYAKADISHSSPEYLDDKFNGKDMLEFGAKLSNYLSSLRERPVLSIRCNDFSRKEVRLVRGIFNLYNKRKYLDKII
ncbi:MAG: hypothetical protein AABX29_00740 [Nanoarchaeota archaeon]